MSENNNNIMNLNNYTIKSQEAIQKAQEITLNGENQAIETGHLLKGIFVADDDVVEYALKKVNANRNRIESALDAVLLSYSKVSGGGQIYLSNDANRALAKAQKFMKDFGDEFVTVEHMFLALVDGKDQVGNLLKDAGVELDEVSKAFKELRGGNTVNSQSAENQFNALKKYAKDLNELAQNGKLDPVIGRDDEIRRVLQILSRRPKNNPI
jgi:ATP-dependent Clp protease ATP-binding subunit ClpB